MGPCARLSSIGIIVAAALAALLASPPTAAADGLPVVGIDARPVSAPGAELAYVTRRAGRDTRLEVIDAESDRKLRRVRLPGELTVPAIAYDATPSGITPDGRKLVLITPRRAFPRATTSFAIVDTRRLRIRRMVRLKGDFSFDAVSPDGRLMYLIRYPSRRDILRYEVRTYDLRADRLLPKPIVDPREPDERMSGLPVTRATSADGRWEYTLYDGAEYPFVHALDTERGEAFCIDLDGLGLQRGALWGAKLELGVGVLTLTLGNRPLARIDAETLRVTTPSGAPRKPAVAGADEAGVPWLLVGLPTLLLAASAATVAARARTRRRRAPA